MAPVINVRNLYSNVFRKPWVQQLLPKNPTARQAANLALWSTLTKDAVGCAMYTVQSYNNKEIPDDKRTFVTALDLSNGISNVTIPMITGPILSKHSDKLFEKYFGHNFSDAACERMHAKLTKAGHNFSKESVANVIKKQSKAWSVLGFGVITMLIYSQILVKRILTPTLSTSLADYVKIYIEKYDESKAQKAAQLEKLKAEKAALAKCDVADDNNKTEQNPFVKSSVYVVSPSFDEFNKTIINKKAN